MKFNFISKFFLFIFLLINTNAYSEGTVAFLDLDKIMKKSSAGISISKQLENLKKKEIGNFKKKEALLQDNEKKLISQKNVLSKDEFKKKVLILRNEIKDYKSSRNQIIKISNQKMIKAQSSLLSKLNPILSNYSKENNIHLIIPKKNIIIGRSELDITNAILKILDKKIKTIKVD